MSAGFREDPLVTYILSLGVVVNKRRQGIGRKLLHQLLLHLNRSPSTSGSKCKAVFLHVLSSNADAIRFYESQNFSRHQFLPLYYLINGSCRDGISYVRYLNGGRAPVTCSLISRILFSLFSHIPVRLIRLMKNFVTFCTHRLSRLAKVPARFTHRMPRSFEVQNPAVKYHHVASA